MKLLKKYAGYLILGSIEIIVYVYKKPNDLELFFMGWGFFFFALLIYNVFNVFSDGSMNAIGVDKKGSESKLEKSLYSENRNDRREWSGFLDLSNLIFIILVMINLVGYLVIMPK